MDRPLIFSGSERREVDRALSLAESYTGLFYGIPGREWPQYPYEVRTLAEGPGPEAPVFADVVRAVPLEAAEGRSSRPRFRVRLRDDVILAKSRDVGEVGLFPMLLYVLTHELVHVVRFGSGLADFDAPPEERRCEEARVDAVTRRILAPAADPALDRFVSYLDDAAAPPLLTPGSWPK